MFDVTEFHRHMRDKYAEKQGRHVRLFRIRLMFMALAASSLSFVLAYLRYAGK